MARIFRSVLLLLLLIAPAAPAFSAVLADEVARGPKVGQTIPHSLRARDQNDRYRDFRSLARRRGLIVMFSRSLGWWPYCQIQAVAWNERIKDIRALGYDVAVVTDDSVPTLTQFAERENIAFTLLADPKAEIIRAFDLIDNEFAPGSRWYGTALPVTFVVDARGVITHRFSYSDYRIRPDVGAVLKLLKGEAGG